MTSRRMTDPIRTFFREAQERLDQESESRREEELADLALRFKRMLQAVVDEEPRDVSMCLTSIEAQAEYNYRRRIMDTMQKAMETEST